MSAFTGLAILLGIGIGIGISYWYVRKKSKRLVQKAMDILNGNNGVIPNIHSIIDTFKSEVGEMHQNPAKKEGEKPKEDLTSVESAPSPNNEGEKGVVKTKNKK